MASAIEQVERRVADLARPGIVETRASGGPTLAGKVTAALRSAGQEGVAVLECSGVREDALRDLLVAWLDERGLPARVLRADFARLVREDGRIALLLRVEDGTDERLPLTDLSPSDWLSCGLRVPSDWLPLREVSAALARMLAGSGWSVESLGRFEDGLIGELVLVQRDARELPVRRLRAAVAEVVPVGPELVLSGGVLESDGDERPFFDDIFRLPLPGADYGAWLDVTRSAP